MRRSPVSYGNAMLVMPDRSAVQPNATSDMRMEQLWDAAAVK